MSRSDDQPPGLPADGDPESALAAGPLDEADRRLIRGLREELEATDPVPDGLVERIEFELTLDALHAEAAVLTAGAAAPAGVRSAAVDAVDAVRVVTFTSPSLTTMLTVTPETGALGGLRVDGWCAPATAVTVTLRQPSGSRTTRASADGRFSLLSVPAEPATFLLTATGPAGRISVVSPTIDL